MNSMLNQLRDIDQHGSHEEVISNICGAVARTLTFRSNEIVQASDLQEISDDTELTTLYYESDSSLSWYRLSNMCARCPNIKYFILNCQYIVGGTSTLLDILNTIQPKVFIVLTKDAYKTKFVETMAFLKDWNSAICDGSIHVFYQGTGISEDAQSAMEKDLRRNFLLLTSDIKPDPIINTVRLDIDTMLNNTLNMLSNIKN